MKRMPYNKLFYIYKLYLKNTSFFIYQDSWTGYYYYLCVYLYLNIYFNNTLNDAHYTHI